MTNADVPNEFPSVGAYIIARNEEKNLERALRSLQSVCREIIVVDTGSTDSTPEIATRFGAELHFFLWNNDFSQARNFAISLMRTDWIIALDADEMLDTDSVRRALPLFKQHDTGGFLITILNELSGSDGEITRSSHTYTRIFRRHHKIRYSGAIHEQIAPSIRACGFNILESSMRIFHSGYVEISPEKIERNLTLLRKELSKNPHDAWLQYHLASTEFSAKHFDTAKLLFHSALDSRELSTEQIEMTRLRLAQIALAREEWRDLETMLNFSSADVEREGFRLFLRGTYLALQHRFSEAESALNRPEIYSSHLVDAKQVQLLLDICKGRYSQKLG